MFDWSDELGGEHPAVVVGDICRRQRPAAHVITFANDAPGSGKSTLAFHCAVALANAGAKVLAVDCDAERATLGKALSAREASARALGVQLPAPRRVTLYSPSAAILLQEIARLGTDCRFVVIDTPSRDTPSVRRAIALADTLVTPVDSMRGEVDALALRDPKTRRFAERGRFSKLVSRLGECAAELNLRCPEWMLVATRGKQPKGNRKPVVSRSISQAAKFLDTRLATALPLSPAYCDLFTYGLALSDLRHIDGLEDHGQGQGRRIERLLAEMRLPLEGLDGSKAPHVRQVEIPRTMRRYSETLRENVGALAAAL